MRLRFTVAYDGTKYVGWQLQNNGPSVQGVLEKAFERIVDFPVRVHGSGRTDSGVHAMGQVAHVDVPDNRSKVPWRRAINARLPSDVSVMDVRVADPEFHSRYWARSKTYAYTLWHEREFVLPHRARYVWNCGELDLQAMEHTAEIFMGKHDFSSFQNAGTEVKTTIRTITEISRNPGQTPYETVWRFTANGFLKQMVRNLMGCMVRVGRGKVSLENVRSILDERDRTKAPATAPPQGLSLEKVFYEDE